MIINQQNLDIIYTAYQAAFQQAFRNPVNATADRISTLIKSTTAAEKYGFLGQWPELREWIGDRQAKNLVAHDYSLKNKDFESTVAIPKNAITDDQYGLYSSIFADMGYAAAMHPDKLVYALLSLAFSTNCYDGQYMCDTDHPVGDTTVSNSGGGAGAPWFLMDCNRPLKPIIFQQREPYTLKAQTAVDDEAVFTRKEFRYGVDTRCNVGFGLWQLIYGSKDTLNDTNFNLAYKAMMSFTSDEGRPLGIMPSVLVVGPTNRAAAKNILETERLASGASNINYKAVDLIVSPFLT